MPNYTPKEIEVLLPYVEDDDRELVAHVISFINDRTGPLDYHDMHEMMEERQVPNHEIYSRGGASYSGEDAAGMHLLDTLLGNRGIEAIESEDGSWVDSYHGSIIATYSNTGDAYTNTVVYDTQKREVFIASWGDWVEHMGGRLDDDEDEDTEEGFVISGAVSGGHDEDYGVPVYRGRQARNGLTRYFGLPNSCPRGTESPFGNCRVLFVDDDTGDAVAAWVPEGDPDWDNAHDTFDREDFARYLRAQ